MQNITSTAELKSAIQLLEAEQAINGRLLKEQFHIVFESLKPINLLKSTLNDAATSPYLIDNILVTAMGLATGYLSKKILIGDSGSMVKKIIGFILQFGVTNAITQHPDAIKSFGKFIFQSIFNKKETNSDKL